MVSVDFPEPDRPTKPMTSPGFDRQRDVAKRLTRVRPIAQRHAAELDRAARRRQGQQVLWHGFGRRVEDVAETRDRDLHLLKVLPQLRQAKDRLHHLACDHIEGDEFADRHRAFDHRLRADKQDQRRRDFADILDQFWPSAPVMPASNDVLT